MTKHSDLTDAMIYGLSIKQTFHIETIGQRIWASWQCLKGNVLSIVVGTPPKKFYKKG